MSWGFNRIYRGEIVHKDKAYPGQHEAIIDPFLWDEVQGILAANTNGERREGPRQPSLLTGLIVDEQGEGLTPSHALKQGRRYRYYVSRHLITDGKTAERTGWRLPAADLEALVTTRLRDWLGDAAAVSGIVAGDPLDAPAHAVLLANAKALAERWPCLAPADAKPYLNAFIRRVVIRPDGLTLEIDPAPALPIPTVLKRAGMGMTLIIPGAHPNPTPDPSLIRLLLRAFAIQDRLAQHPDLTLQQIACADGVSASYVTRLLRLGCLAPDIVAAIIDGRQPPELTANRLMRDTRLPLTWPAQRARLGFAPS